MDKKTYKWRKKYPGKIRAQVAGEELERLARRSGVTAETVLKSAESPDSPLHVAFQWDDTIAARGYRLQQAEGMLCNLVIIVQVKVETAGEPEVVEVPVRALPCLTDHDTGESVFVQVETALNNAEWRLEIIGQARKRANQARDIVAEWESLIPEFARPRELLDQAVEAMADLE